MSTKLHRLVNSEYFGIFLKVVNFSFPDFREISDSGSENDKKYRWTLEVSPRGHMLWKGAYLRACWGPSGPKDNLVPLLANRIRLWGKALSFVLHLNYRTTLDERKTRLPINKPTTTLKRNPREAENSLIKHSLTKLLAKSDFANFSRPPLGWPR